MLWTIYRTPGFIKPGSFKHDASYVDEKTEHRAPPLLERLSFPPPTLEDIISKEVFVCQPDGTPRWCNTCKIWRPDRSRHCREKNRCVLKLDHFCPWVGGIVSEQSMKYFILFNSYTFIYTIFDWILAAVCIVQRDRRQALNGNIVAMLILGLFFMGLTGGIGFSAILNALTNHTTVENTAEPAGHQWNMAIRVPHGQAATEGVRTITFPDSSAKDPTMLRSILESTGEKSQAVERIEHGRTFAIVTSNTFANPWDCGMYENWCQVMGRNVLGWFIPMEVGQPWFSHRAYVRDSVDGESIPTSFFPTSIDVEIMKARTRLVDVCPEEEANYEERLERRRKFPYLLGGAGAPRVSPWTFTTSKEFALLMCTCLQKQWAASRAGQRLSKTP